MYEVIYWYLLTIFFFIFIFWVERGSIASFRAHFLDSRVVTFFLLLRCD